MSRSKKAKVAAEARRRRSKMKEHLEILRKQASLPLATISIKNEYNITVKKRRKLLKYDRDRAAVRRK